jgi:ribonuclease P protein component
VKSPVTGIRSQKTFKRLNEDGIRAKKDFLGITYLDLKDNGDYNLAFSVSKRVGNAVERNRIRRRLKEIYRLNIKVIPPGSYLLWVNKSAAKANFAALNELFVACIERIKFLREKAC